jgi:hypothetical protein
VGALQVLDTVVIDSGAKVESAGLGRRQAQIGDGRGTTIKMHDRVYRDRWRDAGLGFRVRRELVCQVRSACAG